MTNDKPCRSQDNMAAIAVGSVAGVLLACGLYLGVSAYRLAVEAAQQTMQVMPVSPSPISAPISASGSYPTAGGYGVIATPGQPPAPTPYGNGNTYSSYPPAVPELSMPVPLTPFEEPDNASVDVPVDSDNFAIPQPSLEPEPEPSGTQR